MLGENWHALLDGGVLLGSEALLGGAALQRCGKCFLCFAALAAEVSFLAQSSFAATPMLRFN
jgi:hypothetical protein